MTSPKIKRPRDESTGVTEDEVREFAAWLEQQRAQDAKLRGRMLEQIPVTCEHSPHDAQQARNRVLDRLA